MSVWGRGDLWIEFVNGVSAMMNYYSTTADLSFKQVGNVWRKIESKPWKPPVGASLLLTGNKQTACIMLPW